MPPPVFDEAARRTAETLTELAIAEDLGLPCPGLLFNTQQERVELEFGDSASKTRGDVTSDLTIPEQAHGSAAFVARMPGVIAGLPVLSHVARRFGLTDVQLAVSDGDQVDARATIARVSGQMRHVLALERTALNFLQRLSGIATVTHRFVEAVEGTQALILDTRKTTPGWRALEKYAVRCGGGWNHRTGLYDAILIKDNHLAWLASQGIKEPLSHAVEIARTRASENMLIELEVDSLDQLDRALESRPDMILVDNFDETSLREAVRRRDAIAPGIPLEVSGGVTLATVRGLAMSGVDRISVGALTHSAPSLDIGLDVFG